MFSIPTSNELEGPALCVLGKYYIQVAKDDKAAFECFQQAAQLHYKPAFVFLGHCFRDGKGTQKDPKRAFSCYKKAANLGYTTGHFFVGQCFEKGMGVTKDNQKAFNAYLRGAKQNHLKSQHKVAICYTDAIGVEKNDRQAIEWFRKASARGHAGAQILLVFLLMSLDAKRNKKEALSLAKKAAQIGKVKEAHLFLKGKIFFTPEEKIRQIVAEGEEYYVPEVFPDRVDQVGSYCGSAGLAGAGKYAQEKKLHASSFEQKYHPLSGEEKGMVVLDELQNTPFPTTGPQYNIHSFTSVAERVGLENCKAIVLDPHIDKGEFKATICNALKNNYVLILPCDSDHLMPSRAQGKSTHWVFGFGYWSDKKKDYKILVTHHGAYCEWSIDDLYFSNKQLPEKNPLADGDLKLYKWSLFMIPFKEIPKHLIKDAVPNLSAA